MLRHDMELTDILVIPIRNNKPNFSRWPGPSHRIGPISGVPFRYIAGPSISLATPGYYVNSLLVAFQ